MNIEDAKQLADTFVELIGDWRLEVYRVANREPTQRELFHFLGRLKTQLVAGMREAGLPENHAEERRASDASPW